MIGWRFARAADIERFYGERPERTLKAVAIFLDEEPVAICGIATQGDHCLAFSDVKPALSPHLRSMTVLRAIKATQALIAASKLPVFALKTTESGLLARLGFTPTCDPEVYQWAD